MLWLPHYWLLLCVFFLLKHCTHVVPIWFKGFFSLRQKAPSFFTCSHCLGVNLMRNLTVFCLFRPWANGEGSPGFRLPVCVCVCDFELTSERTQAVDKLSVFREVAWRLGLFNGCQSEFRVTTCQSGLTSPAGKLRGEKKKHTLPRAVFFKKTNHLVLLASITLMSGPIQRLICPITAVWI